MKYTIKLKDKTVFKTA